MSTRVFSTPRPMPGRLLPALAGSAVVALALPVFAILGWPLAGWALAAILWGAGLGLQELLTRFRGGADTLAAAGVMGIGMSFRAMAVGVPLVAATAADEALGLSAALLYTLAFTLALAISLLEYFGTEARA